MSNPMLPMIPGLAMFALGFVLVFAVLVKLGAMAKSRQIAALGDALSGRAGGGARFASLLGLALLGVGACTTFAGVAARDRAECEAFCTKRGYAKGVFRDSTARSPKNPERAAFRACACEGGPPGAPPLEVVATQVPAD